MQLDYCSRLQIAVCDDEELSCAEISRLAGEILRDKHIECSITQFRSGESLLEAIDNGQKFDLLLLDVMLEKMSGMELAVSLRKRREKIAIIFISNNKDMAMQGYEVEALRYLAKPVNRERLQEALIFCCGTLVEKREIQCSTNKGECRISSSEIQYIEVYGRKTQIKLLQEEMECKQPISKLEMILPSNFVRCHQGFLVNLAFVRYVRRNELEMQSGIVIPISKYRHQEVMSRFVSYLAR